jgi:hypothetical protein
MTQSFYSHSSSNDFIHKRPRFFFLNSRWPKMGGGGEKTIRDGRRSFQISAVNLKQRQVLLPSTWIVGQRKNFSVCNRY